MADRIVNNDPKRARLRAMSILAGGLLLAIIIGFLFYNGDPGDGNSRVEPDGQSYTQGQMPDGTPNVTPDAERPAP